MKQLPLILILMLVSACTGPIKEILPVVAHKAASAAYKGVCSLPYPTESWLLNDKQISRKTFQEFCGRKDIR